MFPKEININLNVKSDQDTLAILRKILHQGEQIMSALDDLKAQLADIKQSQADAAVSAADLADDVDQLLVLVQAGSNPDPDVVASVTEIQTTARAQADALKATSQKFPAADKK